MLRRLLEMMRLRLHPYSLRHQNLKRLRNYRRAVVSRNPTMELSVARARDGPRCSIACGLERITVAVGGSATGTVRCIGDQEKQLRRKTRHSATDGYVQVTNYLWAKILAVISLSEEDLVAAVQDILSSPSSNGISPHHAATCHLVDIIVQGLHLF